VEEELGLETHLVGEQESAEWVLRSFLKMLVLKPKKITKIAKRDRE